MKVLHPYKEQINALCRKHKVQHLFVFGSVLSESFSDQSDIDFLVRFKPLDLDKYADNYYEFKFGLQQLLQRRIDLLEDQAIHNPFFRQNIEAHQQLLYAA